MKSPITARKLSRHIVVDPKICHGKPTFRGTRVLVADVLDQIAAGMDWDAIIDDWNQGISEEAIREAVQLTDRVKSRSPSTS